jgi:hypothetical protein
MKSDLFAVVSGYVDVDMDSAVDVAVGIATRLSGDATTQAHLLPAITGVTEALRITPLKLSGTAIAFCVRATVQSM